MRVYFGVYASALQRISLNLRGKTLMDCELTCDPAASERLKSAINDLRALQSLLLCGDLDPRVLSDFRDALNRVRNVAWAAQQSVAAQVSGNDSVAVGSLLAAERIRAAYQLCRHIQEDLGRDNEIQFHKGQLAELHAVVADLAGQLKNRL
jgi:hypothetical protein